MARKIIVAGNWKMNPSSYDEAKLIFQKIKSTAKKFKNVNPIICPPFVYLRPLSLLLKNSSVSLGTQDIFHEEQGSYTGQTSVQMIDDSNVRYSIVGHSEKRQFGESDEIVSKKINLLAKYRIKSILCIGEKKRDEEGNFFSEIKNQILLSLAGVRNEYVKEHLIIAYEPLWEIGRPDMKSMEPSLVRETVIFIKKVLRDAYGEEAKDTPVIYGGSVSEDNILSLIKEGGANGFLVGRQSLLPDSFSTILKIANGQ